MNEVLKELEKQDRYINQWLGSVMGKSDRMKKEQKHYLLIIMFLQSIILILLMLKVL